ncbi:MAG: ABC transporter permease subunit [Acidimicrobiia bacterium]|nr:ABC transporter permease subunit [Acidimicrobiia bacterium]NND13581.1 ABC transporter permease subunit [Acidimicrobiia bacterium]NNL47833.1 ABC transporter permease subunit [Acidimicrobiia bacterium]
MIRTLTGKGIWDRRKTLMWWGIGMTLYVILNVAFFPSLKEESFSELFESVPEAMLAAFGIQDIAALSTGVGYVNSQLYDGFGTILVAAWAIAIGATTLSSEEDSKTMDMLLSLPVSRTRVVLEKWLAMVVLMVGISAVIFLVLVVSNPIWELDLTLEGMVWVNLGLALLSILFGTLAMAVSAVSGRRGLAIGASGGLLALLFLLYGLGSVVDSLESIRGASPFYWYLDSVPLAGTVSALGFLGMAFVTLLFLAIAVLGFNRRDVGV